LFQKSVSFLGHVISDAGIGTDPKKIKIKEKENRSCRRMAYTHVC